MKPLIYDPRNGYPITEKSSWISPPDAQDFRNTFPTAVWKFNPWTGVGRDVDQDPYGLALPDEDGIYNPVEKKMERDPNGVPPQQPGAKLDSGKSPVRRGLLEYFPRACMAVAGISAAGAEKYTWGGWQTVEGGIDRYGDAEVRHICKAAIEGEIDPDFGLMHAAHEAWGALARLELILRDKEKRP